MKIILIGAGKLGKQLYRAIVLSNDLEIIQWVNRSSKKTKTSEGVPIVEEIGDIKNIELYLLAVSDESIGTISNSLPKEAFVVHSAGGISLSEIIQKRAGVFYPLQSFSKDRNIDFSKTPVCVESKIKTDLDILKNLAKSIKSSVFDMNSKQREQLHLAAVIVNNFTNHLFLEAAEICKKNSLSFELLKPIIKETFEKLETLSPKDAQTGPALRRDKKTINKHLKLIESPDLRSIYKVFTLAIQKKNEK
jgi:predicted short-subunit dehydrogenase-like oxidoreductase (DUF2520 family)